MSALEHDALVKASGYKIKYHPYGASADAFKIKDDELLLAGPKGTGKSLGLMHKLHLILSKYPEAKGFMCRKTRTSMTNSCLDMFQRHVLKPPDKVHFHKQDQQFNYPNGSVCAVIGLDNVDRLNSSEWDIGYMQEATEASENDWEVCTACIRNGVVPYQQMMGDCNPDKPTHWLKVRCDKGLTTMLRSVHQDNPKFFDHNRNDWTTEGKRYIAKLQRLSGVRYKRLYRGEWAAAEGVVYDMWDPSMHVINMADLPTDWTEWPCYWSVDFGFKHPFVWQVWVENPKTGQIYLVREIYKTQTLVEDHAEQIRSIWEGMPSPRAIICDHDAEGRATIERHLGLLTLPAYKSIQVGIQAVQKRLRPDWCPQGPGIFIVRDALVSEDKTLQDAGSPYNTEQEFDGYVWDTKIHTLAKKDELPVDKDNHGMDALRYIVAFLDSLADDPQEQDGYLLYDEEDYIISPF